ncbi:hypothetical protein FOVG_17516 [Fusarium oxysporum f. sp. pisi HDV247]|uniref:Major facilitator superfamily (MFS) profile domain-containing protein n=1 Tax=Fusarium oxysporum f. sp. pisi HDV247 TaxID=1080344 RepID=W9NEJ4_FUSOX|nr:hypothetical protein FOVG_17516 [Fusarium oxysporum f. sp. pisi HDV247]
MAIFVRFINHMMRRIQYSIRDHEAPIALFSSLVSEADERSSPLGDGVRPPPLEQIDSATIEDQDVFIVDWNDPDDIPNHQNWPDSRKWTATVLVLLLALLVGVCAPIEAPIAELAARDFGVSEIVESLSVALFLAGMGFGALVAGPFSEVLGRSGTYTVALLLMCIWLMASPVSQHISPRLVFRFLGGFSGAAPLVCSGGTISDLWSPTDRTFPFLFFAIVGFGTPPLGPVFSAWIPNSPHLHTWRWAEWVAVLFSGVVFIILLTFQPETHSPLLLSWKARHLRNITGEGRYCARHELDKIRLPQRLRLACARPFIMAWNELTIKLASLYLSFVYIVLFTFFDGYPTIFQETYGLSTGMTFTLLAGITVGAACTAILGPIVHRKSVATKISTEQESRCVDPASRLWFAMLAAPGLPISLFWMGWTAFSSISIWSPLAASVLFGFSITGIFIGVSMYIIDVYARFAASAMAFTYLARCLAAAAMTVVGIPLYDNLGRHWTLTLLGCISVILTPLPYIFFRFDSALQKNNSFMT